jgi:methyl halide transferase
MQENDQSRAEFWNERWKNGETQWDMKQVSPPLKAYFDTLTNKDAAILIPGCGNAYEAQYLLQSGFTNITLIDISVTLVHELLQQFQNSVGKELTIICGDFFHHTGQYDVIVEQTFFCALLPELRKAYCERMRILLKKEGVLAGLLFDKQFENNPPYGGSRQEYETLFSSYFKIKSMEPCNNSIAARSGAELFFECMRK